MSAAAATSPAATDADRVSVAPAAIFLPVSICTRTNAPAPAPIAMP